MDFRALATFVQVAELGSFTRAAQRLGYSQPTISFQIKQLEKELGIQLFERIGHTVHLTPEGRHALSYAQSICRLSQQMAQGTQELQQAQGVIRLAMSDSLCTPLIVRRFGDFRRKYPHVSLIVHNAGTSDMYRMLEHNEVDIVCTLDSHIYNTAYVVADEEKIGAHFICCSAHPLAGRSQVSISELLEEPFLLTEKGMSYRRLLDEALAKMDLEIHPVLEMESVELICQLVSENMGLSFLPDFITEQAVQRGSIVRLNAEGFTIDLWRQLLYHRDKWISLPMEAMLTHLSQSKVMG